MRIGLISDVHGNLSALRAVMRRMRRTDMILCAGDLTGFCVRPAKVISIVRRRKIRSVLGDCDSAVVSGSLDGLPEEIKEACAWTSRKLGERQVDFLRSLPEKIEVKARGFRIMVVHGSPADPLRGRITPETPSERLAQMMADVGADVVVVGHTHRQLSRRFFGRILVNPGSVGQPRDRDPRACFAILRLDGEPEVELGRVEYPVDEEVALIKMEGLPASLVSRLLYGW
jgi:putative phosphoesterase